MIYLDNAATSFPKPEAGLPGPGSLRPQQPGQSGPGRAQDGARRRADARRWPASAQPVLPRQGPERFIFTLNCTDALNMAFKGVLNEGDHVITTDLEHNSVSRPLRAMELAGKISLTRIAGRRRRHRRSRRHSPGHHAEDPAHRPDACQQRARAPCSRSRRSAGWPASTTCFSWSMPPRRPA